MGLFPRSLKRAKILPIFKNEDKLESPLNDCFVTLMDDLVGTKRPTSSTARSRAQQDFQRQS